MMRFVTGLRKQPCDLDRTWRMPIAADEIAIGEKAGVVDWPPLESLIYNFNDGFQGVGLAAHRPPAA